MIDLDKLDKLHEAAAPAEWIAHRSEIIRRDNDTEPWFIIGDLSSDDSPGTMNAEFVVALRNAYRSMSAEMRRLTVENARMREALKETCCETESTFAGEDVHDLINNIWRQTHRALEEVEG